MPIKLQKSNKYTNFANIIDTYKPMTYTNPNIPTTSLINKSKQIFFVLIAIFFAIGLPADAKKDKTSKKKKTEVVSFDIEPDQICRKAKPDTHPRMHEQPNLLYFAGGGKQNLEGIDISHYQGKIDWGTVVADSHVGFVYIKASEGADITDNTYSYNINEAHKHGLKVGSYHFFRANISARDQFQNFKRMIDLAKQDLLPVIDVEVMPKGIAKSKFDTCLEELLRLLEKEYGRKPLIYTGQNFYNKHFYGTKFVGTYKFWIAKYDVEPPILNNSGDYLIWQYSAKGKIGGIKGYVDLNKFMGRHVINEIKF